MSKSPSHRRRADRVTPFLFARAEHRFASAPEGRFDPARDMTILEDNGQLVPLVLIAPSLLRTTTVTKVINEATDHD